jgi:hypothetical protein
MQEEHKPINYLGGLHYLAFFIFLVSSSLAIFSLYDKIFSPEVFNFNILLLHLYGVFFSSILMITIPLAKRK